MAVRKGMAQPDVEAQIIAELPDRPDQARNGVRLPKFFFVEYFSDRSHLPLRRPSHDGSDEDIAMRRASERNRGVEMARAPIQTLRDDARHARAITRVADGVRQEHSEFGGYAWT